MAFRRVHPEASLIVAVPTRPSALAGPIEIAGLPDGSWRNVMTDQAFETRGAGTPVDRSWPFILGVSQGPEGRQDALA